VVVFIDDYLLSSATYGSTEPRSQYIDSKTMDEQPVQAGQPFEYPQPFKIISKA
jgi:hypothetical protein